VLTALVAFAISLLLAELLLPSYNGLVHKELHIPYGQWMFWCWSLALTAFTGIVSGSYPALYLSSFKPVKVLKGKGIEHRRGTGPRQVLVMLQFGFSIVLIIGTLVVYRQIQYVKTRDMGYDRENLVTIKPSGDVFKHFAAVKHDLLASGVVKSVTQSNTAITEQDSWTFVDWPGKPPEQKMLFANLATEYDYTKTMGIKLLMGRDFSEEHKGDSSAVMVNKAALDLMGLKDPIGQELSIGDKKMQLIGVMENTVMRSPDQEVGAVIIQFAPSWFNAITIRLEKTNDLPATLAQIEAIFKKNNPAYPFEYKFVDVEFERKFQDISLAGKLANLFAALAIIITGLGLFGLASYTAEQRTREMGIRKVMGASVRGLVLLMTRDFSRLVLFAFVVSAPLSWWMMNNFLSRYSYRTSIPWWVFPLAGVAAFSFALVIVSIHAARAARANPVNSLRSE
jgi:ABC-type antimicrobial peptide transport system permease subunit